MDNNLRSLPAPTVTVMIPVKNGEKYIRPAIESVLSQTFSNFELLILDDSSTDQTVKKVCEFSDKRVRLIQIKKPLNLAEIRQKGIEEAKGSLIAFLDSDDIALPRRLEKQVYYLSENTKIAAVGSWVELIDEYGNKTNRVWQHATSTKVIPSILLFRNCFTQSSVMVRKKTLVEFGYRQKYWAAPDYDLWSRMMVRNNMANIGQVLTYYRTYKDSMSYKVEREIILCTQEIIGNNLKRLGLDPTIKDIEIHDSLERHRSSFSMTMIDGIEMWLLSLMRKNQEKKLFSQSIFDQVVGDYWFKVCLASANQGYDILKRFHLSSLSKRINQHLLKYLLLISYTTLHKSRIIDVSSEDWRKIVH